MIQTRTQHFFGPRRFTVNSVRRSVFFQPLAMLLAILVLPVLSWLSPVGNDAATRPFQAEAQTIQGCAATGNTIIRNYCFGTVSYANDLIQLESDGVNAYLGLHNLPPSDAHVVYDYGRTDLRAAVRGVMLTQLLAIVQKPASSRTAHEQSLYNWLQAIVQQNEIAYYTQAVNQFNSFIADPCTFTLDSVVAASTKITYDGAPFCNNNFANLFSRMLKKS
jgi:hypothetical protein